MKGLIAAFLLVTVVSSHDFSWSSCGNTEYITVRKVDVSPNPLVFPGKVNYDSEIEIKKPLKDVKMVLKIVRNTFLLDITLPCVKQIGSCTYNKMCSFIDDMARENWGDIGTKIGQQVLAKNPQIGNICGVGIQPSIIKSKGQLDIPELPSILKFVAAVRLNKFIVNSLPVRFGRLHLFLSLLQWTL
ncbi:uncharacterized protein [Watersipora subatra]|uniref:uncharacterized protein isoform X2 n=1 Tax=Watersipora subatra TaxID=2589382 RepID=UPI00355B7CC3